MSEITETVTVQNGQAAMKTVAVSGTLSPKSSATDVVTTVETSDGKQAAVKVYNINVEDYDAEIESLENAVSVLTTSVELSTEIGQTTTVLLDELLTLDVDGRPDYKAPGATVYAENGVTGIIDTIDNSMQTAIVKTVSVSTGGGASGDYLPLSGGTLTGPLVLDAGISDEEVNVITFKGTRTTGVVDEKNIRLRRGILYFDSCYIYDLASLIPKSTAVFDLGWADNKWRKIFVTRLNNGADIAVPTEGGTMARLEDLDNILEIEEF